MKNPFQRGLALFLTTIIILSLASCGGGDAVSKTSSKVAAKSSETDKKIDTSEHKKIVFLVLGDKPTNGRMEASMAEENKLLTQKINAELSLQFIEWADWQTKYQLALASGDSSIDLVGTATDWLYAWPLVRKGAFLPLSDDMLSTYAPQTWKSVPKEDWEECTSGGKIWFIPEDQYTQWTNHGMFYRGDWAKETSLPNGKVNKFEDLETYFDGILKNHPGVVPWDAPGTVEYAWYLFPGYIQSHTQDTRILSVEPAIFYYDKSDPYKVISPFMDGQVFTDDVSLMKKWGDKGFWRSDVLNYQGDPRSLMYAGKCGADEHHTITYVTTTRPQMNKLQPGSDLQFYYYGKENNNLNRDLITHGACAISASSKNAERALMVYDLIRNDKQIYMLHNFGIEGKDYIINKDGTLGHPKGYDATKDALGTNFWYGRVDKFEPDHDDWDIAAKKQIYAELDKVAGKYALSKFIFDPTNVSAEVAALTDVCNSNLPSLAFGKAGDPEEAVKKFRESLKNAGYEKVKAEVQNQLDKFKSSQS